MAGSPETLAAEQFIHFGSSCERSCSFRPELLQWRKVSWLLAITISIAVSMLLPTERAHAACTVPNQITNGQVADATAVMDNFNSLTDCVDSVANATVTPSGTTTTGSLPVFSSAKTITNGDLS